MIFKHIQRLYKLSSSTLKRLEHFHQKSIQENIKEQYLSADDELSIKAKHLTIEYLRPPCWPRNIRMAQRHIEWRLGEKYHSRKVKQFIKNEMGYSYKKGWSRPYKYSTRRVLLVKTLYWSELLKLLIDGKGVVNIDESSFNRSIKNHYSWLPIGESASILNANVKGKSTLILGVWSTGKWFSVIMLNTVNSYKFWIFLRLLELIVKEEYRDAENFPIIVLDNARTHSSKIAQKIIKNFVFKMRFSVPYWPEVAPVELTFGKIKSKLRSQGGTAVIDFEKEKGIEKIFRFTESIEQSSWVRAWIKKIQEAKASLVRFKMEATEGQSDELSPEQPDLHEEEEKLWKDRDAGWSKLS